MDNQKEDKRNGQNILPSISSPKGGGAISGIGEKFSVNAVTGTAGATIPLPVSPARNGFSPQLVLNYDSGSGNSEFGLGWSLSIPSVIRKTAKGLPVYDDASESDVFLLSGVEDLVPFLEKDPNDKWQNKTEIKDGFKIQYYRPRTEGLFTRIEKWTDNLDGQVFWKTTSKENITNIFGRSESGRVCHPDYPNRIFEWKLEESTDNKGNIIRYIYKTEDASGVNASLPFETNRLKEGKAFNRKYIKQIQYGNLDFNNSEKWMFSILFDYGEHDQENPVFEEQKNWYVRKDPFSSFISGFELRTYRLCKRVLLFHQFTELGTAPVMVRSTELFHDENPAFAILKKAMQSGYIKSGNIYTRKSFPPVEYSYSNAELNTKIQILSPENLPQGVDDISYKWVDLYGEGIEGILTEQGGGWFYKSNEGNGNFSPSSLLNTKPVLKVNGLPVLQDIDGDGRKELVLMNQTVSGFYELNNNGWGDFRSFDQMPDLNFQDPNLRFIDLNGDGFADILITEENVLRWYSSKSKKGFSESHQTIKSPDENKGPAILFSDPSQSIYLADMNGDGLMDIVRVRNKDIVYWPNKGHGQFGYKVTMSNSPLIDFEDQFSPSRIRLADIDGTGTTDLLYIGKASVRYWINQSGNQYSSVQEINPVPDADNLITIQLADLFGTGLPCLVWSSPLPSDTGRQLKYIDLFKGKKAWLLNEINNNLGKLDRIYYASSTKYYLNDKHNGQPWVSRLSFPVHVVEMTESIDLIAGASLASSYQYHHGYYDSFEREFRGFGMVEQTDTERFGLANSSSANKDDIPPVLTKTWFHTGLYTGSSNITDMYTHEYFSGDTEAYHLPASEIINGQFLSVKQLREACRTMRGQILRQELYSMDNSSKAGIPYTVTESCFSVRQIQPENGQRFGVYQMIPSETISYSYEREVNDPRISHSIITETDPQYGLPLSSAQIVYPRRSGLPNVFPEQQEIHIVLAENKITHHDQQQENYFLGIPLEQKTFELSGIFPANTYFSSAELKMKIKSAVEIAFHKTSSAGKTEKRLITWSRNTYWNKTQTNPLGFGSVEWPVLLHHSEAAVFSSELILSVFDDGIQQAEKAKYQFHDNYWWNPGVIIEYSKPFYQPVRTIDTYGNKNTIVYDSYNLLAVRTIDALQNITTAVIDYRTFSPVQITDPNGNKSEVITDPLGMTIAVSSYGSERNAVADALPFLVVKGDLPINQYNIRNIPEEQAMELVIANPAYYLQSAGSFFYYDLHAWMNRQEPPQFISLSREKHVSDENGIQSPIHISLGYSDGFGRSIQQKSNVESGDAFGRDSSGKLLLDSSGKPIMVFSASRWISSGRTVFNNKQKPIRQYEPFYTSTFRYETEPELVYYGISPLIHYDPLLRVIRTDFPKGFFSKVEFSSWETRTFDVNDTVKESEYYKAVVVLKSVLISKEERIALDKAAKHADTPAIAYLDSLGRAFIGIAMPEKNKQLISYTGFDISGNPLYQIDARQYELNKQRTPTDRVCNFRYVYDMVGTPLKTIGIDNGMVRLMLNVAGQMHLSISATGFKSTVKYDSAFRPLEIYSEGPGLPLTTIERFIYGEMLSQAEAAAIGNVRGQLIHHFDASGKSSNTRISFKGEILQSQKQLIQDSSVITVPNWAVINPTRLETEIFTTSSVFDALGREIETRAPDGSIGRPVFNLSGQLKKIKVNLRGAVSATEYVTDIIYNDKGQRSKIYYANGTRTVYEYEPLTFRLISLSTTRLAASGAIEKLQELKYTYDPAGNITHISDGAQQTLYYNGMVVNPENRYVYDALYQLVEAEGREHSGQNVPYSRFDTERIKIPHKADGTAMRRYVQQYSYDASGNKTAVMHRSGINTWTKQLQIDLRSNRLVRSWFGNHTSEELFSYDEAGNMQQISSADILTWNHLGELAAISRGTMRSRYTYSGGQRIRKVVEDGNLRKVRYYFGDFELYREYTISGSSINKILERESLHIRDGQQRIVLAETKTFESGKALAITLFRYQYSNQLGSASLELDNLGQIISYEEYYPYGCTSFQSVRTGNEVPEKRYRYTGMERDVESGLNYHSARYYASWMGRWISADPAGTVDGLNLYGYVRGNPVGFVDLDGQSLKQILNNGLKSSINGLFLFPSIRIPRLYTGKKGEMVQDGIDVSLRDIAANESAHKKKQEKSKPDTKTVYFPDRTSMNLGGGAYEIYYEGHEGDVQLSNDPENVHTGEFDLSGKLRGIRSKYNAAIEESLAPWDVIPGKLIWGIGKGIYKGVAHKISTMVTSSGKVVVSEVVEEGVKESAKRIEILNQLRKITSESQYEILSKVHDMSELRALLKPLGLEDDFIIGVANRAEMALGKAMEIVTNKNLQINPVTKGFFEYTANAVTLKRVVNGVTYVGKPDWVGKGILEGFIFDLTTVKGVSSHLKRWYAGPNYYIQPY